jgi:ketosteroid isomerase-like protein
MSEEKIVGVIRDWRTALEKANAEKALSLITDDAVWFTSQGTFKGKEQWKRALAEMQKVAKDVKFKDGEFGIVARGNKATSQYTLEYKTMDGMKHESLGVCLYEFKNYKIQHHWTFSLQPIGR